MDTIDNLLRGLSLYTVRKTPKIFCVLEIYALSKCPSFDGSFHETPDSSYPRGQRWQKEGDFHCIITLLSQQI